MFPLPPVIYNRIVERRWESRPVNQAFLQQAAGQRGITLLNPRFLDKLEVFQVLSSYGELRRFLPLTAAGSRENLRRFLQAGRPFFLKPATGCKGEGILYLRRISTAGWQIEDAVTGKTQNAARDEVEEMLGQRSTEPDQFILQQEVERASFRGRPFDLRVLAQKDGSGRWQYVGAAARIAARGRLLTHMVNGGSRAALESVLRREKALWNSREAIRSELRWLSETLPALLEKQLPGCWGLLAFDMALTRKGKLFLLEVNARPGSFSERTIRQRSLALLMACCRWLAEGGGAE